MQASYSKTAYPSATPAQEPVTDRKYNHRVEIPVDVKSILFKDLIVTIQYKREKRGPITAVNILLGEEGWGAPGLLADDTLEMNSIESGYIRLVAAA